ncbi:hypothetical protein AVEN_58563-1, partial [Araneus ventricosus]
CSSSLLFPWGRRNSLEWKNLIFHLDS